MGDMSAHVIQVRSVQGRVSCECTWPGISLITLSTGRLGSGRS